MKASAERIEKNTVLLEVEVEAEKFSKALDQAYRKLVQKVNIPGFRRGKAPRFLLERQIGKQALVDEAVEIVVPEAYMKAVNDTGIEPVSSPQLEMVQVEEGKPVVFKAKVVVKPEVELGQYTGIEVSQPHIDVSDEDVQRELQRLQQRHARLVPVEEGVVQPEDLVTIDFTIEVDGKPIEGGQGTDYSLEVGSGVFPHGFEDELIGIALHETREVEVKFPENYGAEELRGRDALFRVSVKSIKRKELLPLDDEFAKDISEFDTLQELKADLKNKLEQAAKARAQAELRQKVVSKAVENAQVDIPKEMIDKRVEEMIINTEQRLLFQGISMDNYLKYLGTTLDKMKEQLLPEAEQSLKNMLVLEGIAKAENIGVTDEEIEAELEKIAKETKQNVENMKKILENQEQREMFIHRLQMDKTIQFLVDKAVIVTGTQQEAEE